MSESQPRPHSSIVTDGYHRAPSRAMLRAVGFEDGDFQKAQIGIASTWSDLTPCNMHINELAEHAARGTKEAGAMPVTFGTITISDGISMGTMGMRYSLVSREVIADSIETVVAGEGFDGLVAIGGCDKNMPGCLIAMARLNRPAVFVYGGTIVPGIHRGEPVDIVSVFEAVGKRAQDLIDEKELTEVEKCAIPGPGSCGGMYTANTMASAIEALGMSLPNSSAQLAISEDKRQDCVNAGAAALQLLKAGIKPRDIMTRKAFENAITTVIALGGSTNAVLHLLAIAHATGVKVDLKDFAEIGRRVPVLCDLKPSGKYNMSHFARIGGVTPLLKRLLDNGLLHGDCLTVTGRSMAENLAGEKDYPADQDIVYPFASPVKKDSHLRILYGNLAPTGAVAKISGKEGLKFEGEAIVYDSEESAQKGILDKEVQPGHVVVIRNEGPVGGPGMREMLGPTGAIMGRGIGKEVALITDGRFSGGSHGFVIGHITPEAAMGGPIGVVQNGDRIVIDAEINEINLDVPEAELESRLKACVRPEPTEKSDVLAKYAATVASASEGAVTDKYLPSRG